MKAVIDQVNSTEMSNMEVERKYQYAGLWDSPC